MTTFTRNNKTQFVDLSQVDYAPYNPEQRRDSTKQLEVAIEKEGQLEAVHLVFDKATGRYIAADGNRRIQALRNLGISKVLAFVYEPRDGLQAIDTVNELFSDLNQSKMTLKSGQMLQAALRGGPTPNSSVKSAKTFFELHFTPMEIEGLIKQRVTPTLLSTAKKIAGYCVPGVGKDTPTYAGRVKKTVWWLLRNDTQQQSIAYMRLGYSYEALRDAVDNNKSYVPRMSPGKQGKK